MRIERFAGSDMSSALRQAKAMFGPDAVILDNGRFGDEVHILAARDYDESLLEGEVPSLRDQLTGTTAAATAIKPASAKLFDMPVQREFLGHLRRLGVAGNVVAALGKHLPAKPDGAWQFKDTASLLKSAIPTLTDELLVEGGVVALLGATGVGKTTTAAKLAARFTFAHGRNQVALISTDTCRIGSHEQLASYARALSIPFEVAWSQRELTRALRQFRDRKLVLVDTAGMGQRDVHLARHLSGLRESSERMQNILVMSGTCQAGLTQEVTRAFGQVPLSAAIVTKTDEAVSLGPVLSSVIASRLPVAFVCNGQRIPEDIEVCNRTDLIRLACELSRSHSLVTHDYFQQDEKEFRHA